MIRQNLCLLLFICLSAVACRSRMSQNQVAGDDGLTAILSVKEPVSVGQAITLTFTVKNPADSAQQFCKWHTPFEPFISKYLDITDNDGKEVLYPGAMAKRIMPPPSDAYITVPAGDSVTTTVDLAKGYALKDAAIYHIKYNGQDMSGIKTANEVSFVLAKE